MEMMLMSYYSYCRSSSYDHYCCCRRNYQLYCWLYSQQYHSPFRHQESYRGGASWIRRHRGRDRRLVGREGMT